MNKKASFRYDPLYRVIDEFEEMRIIEGTFKSLFDRLKRISNLGIIPEVFEMAKYPKYEHALGTTHQINNLLDVADSNIIPDKYRKPLIVASLFLHLGHFPYTYSTERAFLLACNLGQRNNANKIKKTIKKRIEKVLNKANIGLKKKQALLNSIFSLHDYKLLYKFFSAEILVEKFNDLKDKVEGLNEEDLETIVRDLIDKDNDGYTYLNLADKADFVQRDALYFGTVRIDISPRHLYSGISMYKPSFSVNEEKLIEYNLDYLTERFYDSPSINWFSRLYEKIVAALIISKNFKIEWLEEYDDTQFKRLICDDLDSNNNKVRLPPKWVDRAKKLFNKNINFTLIFDLVDVSFQKGKDILSIEYELIGKRESGRGLLTYPFNTGILLSIDYLDRSKYPVHPDYQTFSIRIFQDESNRSFDGLLKVIRNLRYYLSFSQVKNVRGWLANQLSWTRKAKLSNKSTINAIADAVQAVDKNGNFVRKYLRDISKISTFDELWHNFENQFIWKERIAFFLQQHLEEREKIEIYKEFTNGLLSLPVRLLQFELTKKYLDEIYDKLIEKISSNISYDKRGDFFEALCLINKIRIKRSEFQFFLNGMVVVNADKPRDSQDNNEFDIIELLINGRGKAECWIYACSISRDYQPKNQKQITKLADSIHRLFPDLVVRTRYIIPENRAANRWSPQEKDAGRNYN